MLIVFLILALFAMFFPHHIPFMYSGGLGVIILILLILVLPGVI